MPICVGIAGGTGSGKSSVARALVQRLGDQAVILEQDWYYRDMRHLSLEERANYDYDYPAAIESPYLAEQIEILLSGKSVDTPRYDFTTHLREQETVRVNPHQVIVVEGIHVLGENYLRELMALKVFVDVAADLRFIRRLRRDMSERGRTMNSVIEQYLKQVRPMHEKFVAPAREHADLILRGVEVAGDVDILMRVVAERLGDSRV